MSTTAAPKPSICLLVLCLALIGCRGESMPTDSPPADLAIAENSQSAPPVAAEIPLEETPHFQTLDQLLLRMIGRNYRAGGSPIYRMDAVRIFVSATNIKAPLDDNPNEPQIEWRLTIPSGEPEESSYANWSFVKGRWPSEPDGSLYYSYVATEFMSVANDVVTASEASQLGRLSISLAEEGLASTEAKIRRSEPLVLESGYRCIVEFQRAPDDTESQFREVIIKFAPIDAWE